MHVLIFNAPGAFSVQGDLALLFVASANEKQWAKSKDMLQKAVESFRA
jgi:predicted oxidoreductase (fatty acid repression mutant protein)